MRFLIFLVSLRIIRSHNISFSAEEKNWTWDLENIALIVILLNSQGQFCLLKQFPSCGKFSIFLALLVFTLLLLMSHKQMTLPSRCSGSGLWFPPSYFWLLQSLVSQISLGVGENQLPTPWILFLMISLLAILCLITIWFLSISAAISSPLPISKRRTHPAFQETVILISIRLVYLAYLRWIALNYLFLIFYYSMIYFHRLWDFCYPLPQFPLSPSLPWFPAYYCNSVVIYNQS